MNTLDALIVTAEQATQIDIINEGFADRRLEPVLAKDGRKVLPAGLLGDIGTQDNPGWWYDYGYLLMVVANGLQNGSALKTGYRYRQHTHNKQKRFQIVLDLPDHKRPYQHNQNNGEQANIYQCRRNHIVPS